MNVHERELMKKKNDWILYAYIIQRLGGETSIEQIQVKLTAWKRRNANSRRISQVMAMHKNKGFKKIGDKWTSDVAGYSKFSSIWAFDGQIPKINKRTLQHWDEKLSP
jgi:hypothetical protein